jgi:excisionase family DNA binding protein
MPAKTSHDTETDDTCTTVDVAQRLGLAVRSVQLMVDRGELRAWKTPGGHRRISRASVDEWLARHHPAPPRAEPAAQRQRVLLIEDSRHFQTLVSMLLKSRFPQVDLHMADDGISGLAMAGKLEPEVLLVDILLPGIDGAMLINGLRSHPSFAHSRLIVVTSLQGEALAPYVAAIEGLPLVHKSRLALELPSLLAAALAGGSIR